MAAALHQAAIQEIYTQHKPASLPLLAGLFAKYAGEEMSLYDVVCAKHKIAPDAELRQRAADLGAQVESATKRRKTSDCSWVEAAPADLLDKQSSSGLAGAADEPPSTLPPIDSVVSLPPVTTQESTPAALDFSVPNWSRKLDFSVKSTKCRGARKETPLVADENAFADLRRQRPPQDPRILHQQFMDAKTTQKLTVANTFAFAAPVDCDTRAAVWHLWLTLSEVGYFVKQMYLGTEFLKHAVPTCDAGKGSPGQAIVYTHDGTIEWLISSGRLYCQNPKNDLLPRLAKKFHAFGGRTGSHKTQSREPPKLDFSIS
jgi:hypothetical protein